MAVYRIRHMTRYRYQEPVTVCHNLAHLIPRDAPQHTWTQIDLDISPDATASSRNDYFGNRMTVFTIAEPHRELLVVSRCMVDLAPPITASLFPTASWESVAGMLSDRPKGEWLAASEFRFQSPQISWNQAIHDWASQSFTAGRPMAEAALDLAGRIYSELKFVSGSTNVTTRVEEIFQKRTGVCQDFAHLAIACLRSMGLAARYVSGYLVTAPPPGQQRLIGADASHAWVSVYVPEYGWMDIDPTNHFWPLERHITVAWGRDFSDVSPLRGVILGGGKHDVKVGVDVIPLDAGEGATSPPDLPQ
jgi:transglutaminase-like putative cysteine protease